VELMRLLDLDIAGEFLVMASTLMYIKSRELLPKEQQVVPEGEDDEEDPRWELIRQLVEYKKFKDAAAQLQVLEARQEDVYPRLPGKPEFHDEPTSKPSVSLFDLINAVNAILKRLNERPDTREIFEDKWSVSEKIEQILVTIQNRPQVRFSDLFANASSRSEVVVTFLALLELIRLKQVQAVQEQPFSEIEISRAPEPVAEEPSAAPGEGGPVPPEADSPAAEPALPPGDAAEPTSPEPHH
jgi:segregation and condensation protein A